MHEITVLYQPFGNLEKSRINDINHGIICNLSNFVETLKKFAFTILVLEKSDTKKSII